MFSGIFASDILEATKIQSYDRSRHHTRTKFSEIGTKNGTEQLQILTEVSVLFFLPQNC